MRTLRTLAVAVAGLALVSSTALAQGPRVLELGIDAEVAFGLDDPRVTVVQIPAGNFRIGFAMVPRISLEPFFSLVSVSGPVDATVWEVGLGLLWHFTEIRRGPYVRPFISVNGASGGGDSDAQFAAGAGLGTKIPIVNGRLAWRLEANFARAFETDTRGDSNRIGLLAGISFFTR